MGHIQCFCPHCHHSNCQGSMSINTNNCWGSTSTDTQATPATPTPPPSPPTQIHTMVANTATNGTHADSGFNSASYNTESIFLNNTSVIGSDLLLLDNNSTISQFASREWLTNVHKLQCWLSSYQLRRAIWDSPSVLQCWWYCQHPCLERHQTTSSGDLWQLG